MMLGGAVAAAIGIDAERKALEEVAVPLSIVDSCSHPHGNRPGGSPDSALNFAAPTFRVNPGP